jgi:hypothetical protein
VWLTFPEDVVVDQDCQAVGSRWVSCGPTVASSAAMASIAVKGPVEDRRQSNIGQSPIWQSPLLLEAHKVGSRARAATPVGHREAPQPRAVATWVQPLIERTSAQSTSVARCHP